MCKIISMLDRNVIYEIISLLARNVISEKLFYMS